jgi:hypothetical protein
VLGRARRAGTSQNEGELDPFDELRGELDGMPDDTDAWHKKAPEEEDSFDWDDPEALIDILGDRYACFLA